MWQSDPLLVVNPKRSCPACGNQRRKRRRCERCEKTGHPPIDLAGLWAGRPGFLVCGGPSLNDYPLERLRERGVCSLGVNNAAAHAPCSAFTFGDPQWKFHQSLFLDPKCLCFAPNGKLVRRVRVQLADGSYRFLETKLADCPATFGIGRSGRYNAKTFLSTSFAHWGRGGKDPDENQPFRRLASMLIGLRLLHYLGCPRVYLLGVDFWMTKEEPYAWGGNRTGGNRIWWKIDNMLGGLRRTFRRAKFRVYNCNADSKCESFKFASFEDAMRDCKRGIGAEPFDLSNWYVNKIMRENRDRYPDAVSLDEIAGEIL